MDGGTKDLPLGELTTLTKQRMKRKKTPKIKEPVAAVRKSTRPRKQTQRVLESADCQNDVLSNPAKKQRTNSRRLNQIDYCRNGQPFMCSACESHIINNSVSKARIKLEKFPIEKETDGQVLQLCVKCAIALNNLATKGPTQEEREKFEEEGKKFGEHWAKLLNDSDASRLYCSYVQSSNCGCIQNFITGTLVAKKRKSSMSVTDSEGTSAAVKAVGTSSSLLEPKAKESSADNFQFPADPTSQLPARVPQLHDGMSRPLSEADQMERAKFLLSLLKESISKKKSHKKHKYQKQKSKTWNDEQLALQKKSLDTFILTNRAKLKGQGFCDRGCKKVLCYSNNFLHKKSGSSEPRLQRTKGGIGQGKVPDLGDLSKFKCCDKECSKIASKHLDKVAQWRLLSQKSQKDMWSVIGQMLGTSDDHGSKICSKFIIAVTGCCQMTVNRVNFQKLLTKVDPSKPEHGLKSHWKRQKQDLRSSDASCIGNINTSSVRNISAPASIPIANSAHLPNPAASPQVSAALKNPSLAASLGSQSSPSTLNNQPTAPQWSTIPIVSRHASTIAGLLLTPRVTTSGTMSSVGLNALETGDWQKFPGLAMNMGNGATPAICQTNLSAQQAAGLRLGQERPGEDIDQKMERLKEEISQRCLNLDNPEAIKSLQELVNELAQTQRAREQQRLLQGSGACPLVLNVGSTSSFQWTTPEMSGHTQVHSKVPLMIPSESTSVLSSCHKGKEAVTVVTSSRGSLPGYASQGLTYEVPTGLVTNTKVPEEIAVSSSNNNTISFQEIGKKFVHIAPKSTGFIGSPQVFRQLPEGMVNTSQLLDTPQLGAFQIITTPQFVCNHLINVTPQIISPQLVTSTQAVNTPQPAHTSQLVSSLKQITPSVTSSTCQSSLTMSSQPATSHTFLSPNDSAGRNLYTSSVFHPSQHDEIPEHHKLNPTTVSRSQPGLSSTLISRKSDSQQSEKPLQSGNLQTKSTDTTDIKKQQSVPAHSQSDTHSSHFSIEKLFLSNGNLVSKNQSNENCPQPQTISAVPFGRQGMATNKDTGQLDSNPHSTVSTSLSQLHSPNNSSINLFSDHQFLSPVPAEYQYKQNKLPSDPNFQLNSVDQQNQQTNGFSQDIFVTCSQLFQDTSASHQPGLIASEMPPGSSSESFSFDALSDSPVKDSAVISFCAPVSETLRTSDHPTTWSHPSGTLSSTAMSSAHSPGAQHTHSTSSLLCKMLMSNSKTPAVTNFNPPMAHTTHGPTFSLTPQSSTQDSGPKYHRSTPGEVPSSSVPKCTPCESLAPSIVSVTDGQSHPNLASRSLIHSNNTTISFALNQSETLNQGHVKVGRVGRTRDPPQVGIVNPYISGVTSAPAAFANSNLTQSPFTRATSVAVAPDHPSVSLGPISLVNIGEANMSRAALNLQNVVEQPHLTSVFLDTNSVSPSALTLLSQQFNQFSTINLGQLSQQTNQLRTNNLGQLSQQTNQLNTSNLGQLSQKTNQLITGNLGQLSQKTNQLNAIVLGQLSQQTNLLHMCNPGQVSQQANQFSLPAILSNASVTMSSSDNSVLLSQNHSSSHLDNSPPNVNLIPQVSDMVSDSPASNSNTKQVFVLPSGSNISTGGGAYYSISPLTHNLIITPVSFPTESPFLIQQGNQILVNVCQSGDPSSMPTSSSSQRDISVFNAPASGNTSTVLQVPTVQLSSRKNITSLAPTATRLNSETDAREGNYLQSGCFVPVTKCLTTGLLGTSFGTNSVEANRDKILSLSRDSFPGSDRMVNMQPGSHETETNIVTTSAGGSQGSIYSHLVQVSNTQALGVTGSKVVMKESESTSVASTPSQVDTHRHQQAEFESQSSEVSDSGMTSNSSTGQNSVDMKTFGYNKQAPVEENSTTHVSQLQGLLQLNPGQSEVVTKPLVAPQIGKIYVTASVHQPGTIAYQPLQSANQPLSSANPTIALTRQPTHLAIKPMSLTKIPIALAHQPTPSANEPTALTHQSIPSADPPPVSPHQLGPSTLPPRVLAHQPPAVVGRQPSLDVQYTISKLPVTSLQSAQDESVTSVSHNTKQKILRPKLATLQRSSSASNPTENVPSLPNKLIMPLKVLNVKDFCKFGISHVSTESSGGSLQSEAPSLQILSRATTFSNSHNAVSPAVQLPVVQTNVDVVWSAHAPVFQGDSAQQILPVRIQDQGNKLKSVPYDSTILQTATTDQTNLSLQTAPTQSRASQPCPTILTPGSQPDSQNSTSLSQQALFLHQPANLLSGNGKIITSEGITNLTTSETPYHREILLNTHGGVQTQMIVNNQYSELCQTLGSTENAHLTSGKNLTSANPLLNQSMTPGFMNSIQLSGGIGNISAGAAEISNMQNHSAVATTTVSTALDKSEITISQLMSTSGQYHVIQSHRLVNKQQDVEINYLKGRDVIDLTDDSPPNTPTLSMGQYRASSVNESQLPLTCVRTVSTQNQITSHVNSVVPATIGHVMPPQDIHREQALPDHQHQQDPEPQQEQLYQRQAEEHYSLEENQEIHQSVHLDNLEFKTILQHESSDSRQQSGSSFNGTLSELGTRISTTPIFFLSPQTGTANSKDDSQHNSFQTLDEETARQILASLMSQVAYPQLFMESRTVQPQDHQFNDLLLSGGQPHHSETQVNGIGKVFANNDFPSVTTSLNQDFNQSDPVLFSPSQAQDSQSISGREQYFTHVGGVKPSESKVSSSSNSEQPQSSSEESSHPNFLLPSLSSLTNNKTSTASSLPSLQISTSLMMPSSSLTGMSFPKASPIKAIGSSPAVSFTRATNTPKGAVGPPNITVLSPSKPNASQLPRARSESNSASAVFTVVSQANATANSSQLYQNKTSSDTGHIANRMSLNSSVCTQSHSLSSAVSMNLTTVNRPHEQTVPQTIPPTKTQADLSSSVKSKEAFVKLTEAHSRQTAKPKKRPATVSELLKQQNHPVMGTYVFKGPPSTSEQKENPAMGQGLNIEVKNLQLISRCNSKPDRTSSASGLRYDPRGIKVLQPNTASLSSEALSNNRNLNSVDVGSTTMLTFQPVLQLPLGQLPVTFTSSRPVTESQTALPKLMIAPSVPNALTNSMTAPSQSGLKIQPKAPKAVFTEPSSNGFNAVLKAEKSPQMLKLQTSTSADLSISRKETLSLEPKMRLINQTQVSSAPAILNVNSTIGQFSQQNFKAGMGQKSVNTCEKLSLRPSSSFNSEEGLSDNQIYKFKLTGNQQNEAKFAKNATGQSKTFLSFGQKLASPSGVSHKGDQGHQLSEPKLCLNNSQLLQLIKPKCGAPSVSSTSDLPSSPQGNPDLILKFPQRKESADTGRPLTAEVKDIHVSHSSSHHPRHQLTLHNQSPNACGSVMLPVTSAQEQIQGVEGSLSNNRIQRNPLLANILFEKETLVLSECGPSAVKKMKQGGNLDDSSQKPETIVRTHSTTCHERAGQPDSFLVSEQQFENQKSGFSHGQDEVTSDMDHSVTNLTGKTPRWAQSDHIDSCHSVMTASSQPPVYQAARKNVQKISVHIPTQNSHHSALARCNSRSEAENLKSESGPSGRIDKVINDIYNFHEEGDASPPPSLASSKSQSAYQSLNSQADGSEHCFSNAKTFHYDVGRSHIYTEDSAKFTAVNKTDKNIQDKLHSSQSHWDGAETLDWRNSKRVQKGSHKLSSKKVQFSDEVTNNTAHGLLPDGHAIGESGKKHLTTARCFQGFDVGLTSPKEHQLSHERGEFFPHYMQEHPRPVEAVSPDREVALTVKSPNPNDDRVPQPRGELLSPLRSSPENSLTNIEKHHLALPKKTPSNSSGYSAVKFKPTHSRGSPSLKIQSKVGHPTLHSAGEDFLSQRYKPYPTTQDAQPNQFKPTAFHNEMSSFNILSTKGYSKLSSKRKIETVNSSPWSPNSHPIDNSLKLIHNTETKDSSCTATATTLPIIGESTSLQPNRWPVRNETGSYGVENERKCSGSPQRFGLLEVDYETAQQMPNKKSNRRLESNLPGHSAGTRDLDNTTMKVLGMAYGMSSPPPGFTQEMYSENQNLNKEIQEKLDENIKLKKALALAIRDQSLVTHGGRENPEKFQASPVFDKVDLSQYELEDSRKSEEQRKRHVSSTAGNPGILKHSPLPEAEMAKFGEVFTQKSWQPSQMTEQELHFSETTYRGNTPSTSYIKLPTYVEGRSPPVIKGKDPLVSSSSVGRPSSRPDLDSPQYENPRRFQSLSSKNGTEADGLFLQLDHGGRHRNPSSSQRAQDLDPPPYDMSHRHRNPSASSVKSANQDTDWLFEPLNRSRNPSSSSWLADFTSIRSRNPSGSSNRRSRPGSSNSDREFPLTGIDEFSFFLTDLGRTRSRNSSGESIEVPIWPAK